MNNVIQHNYFMRSNFIDIKLYINGIKINALSDYDDFATQILANKVSGGTSIYMQSGINRIEYYVRILDEKEILNRLEDNSKNYYLKHENRDSLINAVAFIGRSMPTGVSEIFANLYFSTDNTGKLAVHVWNLDPNDSEMNVPENNNEYTAKFNEWLANNLKIESLDNEYTRVTIDLPSKVSFNPTWTEARPFDNSQRDRAILEEGYLNYWEALQHPDSSRLFYQYYLKDMARYESDEENIFQLIDLSDVQKIHNLTLPYPYGMHHFDIETNRDKKLIRLIQPHEEVGVISPIIYRYQDQPAITPNPFFSIINNKAIITIV